MRTLDACRLSTLNSRTVGCARSNVRSDSAIDSQVSTTRCVMRPRYTILAVGLPAASFAPVRLTYLMFSRMIPIGCAVVGESDELET
ncbi:hypothetical protein R75465_08667 [Paraburkholderia aspalathi]|nr:hypothetical protein R75465_08667 [Paraburkholderia aspalathi]